jgi:hypothetical protein
MVALIAAYHEDADKTTCGSLAWKEVAIVPSITHTTDTLKGESSSRRVSESCVTADLEEEYMPGCD